MHASFIAAGPSFRQGLRVPWMRMIDVAPTLAQVLGVELGPQAEGVVMVGLLAEKGAGGGGRGGIGGMRGSGDPGTRGTGRGDRRESGTDGRRDGRDKTDRTTRTAGYCGLSHAQVYFCHPVLGTGSHGVTPLTRGGTHSAG